MYNPYRLSEQLVQIGIPTTLSLKNIILYALFMAQLEKSYGPVNENASSSIAGGVMDVRSTLRSLHPSKALLPILVTLLGMVTEVKT